MTAIILTNGFLFFLISESKAKSKREGQIQFQTEIEGEILQRPDDMFL
jgi:hypothetical protein